MIAMQTRVQKWGNSLGVRIPRGLAEEVGLGAGTEVSLSAKDGELVVSELLLASVLMIFWQRFQKAIFIRLLIRDRLSVRRSSSVSDACP